jgi:hypothetical protein
MHDNEHEVAAEPEIADLEEIAAPDRRCLIVKEGRPSLARRRAAKSAQVALDCALSNVDAELEQLAAKALGAPCAVFGRHALDECDDSRFQTRPWRRLRLRTLGPKATEEVAVPAQQRLRLDEHQRVPPIGDHRRETNEDEAVNDTQVRALYMANSDNELVAQEGIFREEVLARERARSTARPRIGPLWGNGASAERTAVAAMVATSPTKFPRRERSRLNTRR